MKTGMCRLRISLTLFFDRTRFNGLHSYAIVVVLFLLLASGCDQTKNKDLNSIHSRPKPAAGELTDGDIIFQTTTSQFSDAILLATHSSFSHCGIVFIWEGHYYVFEAIQPVSVCELNEWIARNDEGSYEVKRLKNYYDVLTPKVFNKMVSIGQDFLGKRYDGAFDWSDDRIYCSELVWKIYERSTGIKIGKLRKLSDFDLSSAPVKSELYERYHNNIPYNETVISPEDIYTSDLLETVVKK